MEKVKLYEVSRQTVVDINGKRLYFKNVDGMYSVCYEEDGTVIHVSASTLVTPLPDDYDEILTILKEN